MILRRQATLNRPAGSVGRTFEVNISLEASFLHQFTSQSTTLSEGDNNIFEEYLSATDRMTSLSGEATQGFFHLVDRALDRTMSVVMEGLDGFLEEVGTSFKLEGKRLERIQVPSCPPGRRVFLGSRWVCQPAAGKPDRPTCPPTAPRSHRPYLPPFKPEDIRSKDPSHPHKEK